MLICGIAGQPDVPLKVAVAGEAGCPSWMRAAESLIWMKALPSAGRGHHLAHLLCVHLAHRPPNGEVLQATRPSAVDSAISRDRPVTGGPALLHRSHANGGRRRISLHEGTDVHQDVDRSRAVSFPLSCCRWARRVLRAGVRTGVAWSSSIVLDESLSAGAAAFSVFAMGRSHNASASRLHRPAGVPPAPNECTIRTVTIAFNDPGAEVESDQLGCVWVSTATARR
jgi:hypothetical protein